MTYSVFDLTEHTQLSIRGTTGSHPDSEYVFGVYIGTEEIHAECGKSLPDFTAYDDVEWERAVEMAQWILEWDKASKESSKKLNLNEFKHVHLTGEQQEKSNTLYIVKKSEKTHSGFYKIIDIFTDKKKADEKLTELMSEAKTINSALQYGIITRKVTE